MMRPRGIERIPAGVTRSLYIAAAACFAIAAGIHVLTYTPLGSADALQTLTFVAFPFVFLLFGAVVVILAGTRLPPERLIVSIPIALKLLSVLLLVYVVADFLVMFRLLPGQPTQQAGGFFFDDHGTLIPTSSAGYREGLAYQARLFTGHEMVFFGFAAVFGYQIDRLRSGKLQLAVPTVPELISEFPSPLALSRSVVLETALSPDQCARKLQASVDRIPGWFWTRDLKLWGKVSATGFWLQLAQGSSSQLAFAVGKFAQQGSGTRVQVLLQFKRWLLLIIVGTAVVFPIIGAVIDANFGGHSFVILMSAMAAFALFANLAIGVFQRRRLLSTIEYALSAHRVQRPSAREAYSSPQSP